MGPRFLAQTRLGPFNSVGGLATVPGGLCTATTMFENAVTTIITLLTVIAGVWFMIRLLMAAFSWISSQGDKQAIANARQSIIHAMIGLGITTSSFVIINLIGYALGLNNILSPGVPIGAIWGVSCAP